MKKDRFAVEAVEGLAMGTFLFHIANEKGNPGRFDTYSMDLLLSYTNYMLCPRCDPKFVERASSIRSESG
jgi:hypothetical protein